LYLLGKKTAHFCALDFIHIKARARVESAPSFSRRVVVVSSRVLLPPPSPGRKRRATHRSERETESAVFADNTKKVKSNLSGKEKKPSRDISLSLSLSRSSLHRETRAKKSRDFFHSSIALLFAVRFRGGFCWCSGTRAPLVSDLFSRRELGPEEGG